MLSSFEPFRVWIIHCKLQALYCTYFVILKENVTPRFSVMGRRCNGSRNVVFRIQLDDDSILNYSKVSNDDRSVMRLNDKDCGPDQK
jgi:hypothetical protein